MLQEMIPFSVDSDSTSDAASPSGRTIHMQGIKHRATAPENLLDHFAEEPRFSAQRLVDEEQVSLNAERKVDTLAGGEHSLFQELFFFCHIKRVGDLPGAECIYVETVVDRDSGLAFAKIYPTKSAMNAVDLLATRVFPFFERRGIPIHEIHTRKTSEYCGLPGIHPFETFLATSHIQHLEIDQASRPSNFICEQFYRLLLREFFPLALRRTFQLSLAEVQRDLDTFIETHNAAQTHEQIK